MLTIELKSGNSLMCAWYDHVNMTEDLYSCRQPGRGKITRRNSKWSLDEVSLCG